MSMSKVCSDWSMHKRLGLWNVPERKQQQWYKQIHCFLPEQYSSSTAAITQRQQYSNRTAACKRADLQACSTSTSQQHLQTESTAANSSRRADLKMHYSCCTYTKYAAGYWNISGIQQAVVVGGWAGGRGVNIVLCWHRRHPVVLVHPRQNRECLRLMACFDAAIATLYQESTLLK